MAVLRILAEGHVHPSVEQIFEQVRADFPMISLATIYKTVSLLKDIGEITELSFGDEGHRYDALAHPHPHLICLRCREIRDLDLNTLNELGQRVARETGYEIQQQRLDFFGICPQCQGS
jgi:Fur family peroxide stress response transcriptional regulator